ncbi:MAG: hypothetical protein COB40_11660, partial [Marinosulfonomonas sp.]
ADSAAAFVAAADSAVWKVIRDDCAALEAGNVRLDQSPLWSGKNPLEETWLDTRQSLSEGWKFWRDWYQNALDGVKPNWDMLTKIALIEPEDWNKGADHVNGLIAGIVGEFPVTGNGVAEDVLNARIMTAAFADFSFDAMRNLMDMVPFEEDIRHLRDPERLQGFLDDADELIDGLEDFKSAMTATDGSRQGAPEVKTYVDSVLSELSRARQLNHLRVRRLLDLGAVLQDFSLEDRCRMGLGDGLAKQLDRLVATMLDLTRSHFAPSFVRLKPLNDLVLLPGDDPRKIIAQLESNLAAARRVKDDVAVPLNPQDLEVLGNILEELKRLARAIENAEVPDTKADLEGQFARKSGQLGVTFGRYWIIARGQAGKLGDGVEFVLKQFKKVKGLQGLLEWVNDLWDKIPWS